ncbi:hypothetical protein TWF730_005122 [Orbilia blumenaviensis]|uniref:Uncharacterized protein n=1 Tax=Orbilia blumenaviensis TaxID=1796055 RepID=A0AAV9VJS7_9PEZI
MDKGIAHCPCNEHGSLDDEKENLSHEAANAKAHGVVTLPPDGLESKSREEARPPSNLGKCLDVLETVASKSSAETPKGQVEKIKDGEGKENQNNGDDGNYQNIIEKDETDLEYSGFEFDFENQPPKAKIEIHETSDDEGRFQRAASITSSCLDALEDAEILTAKEVKLTRYSIKDITLEERDVVRPYDDDMTAALIPKGPKVLETRIHEKEATQRLLRSIGRVPPSESKGNSSQNINAPVTKPVSTENLRVSTLQPKGRPRPVAPKVNMLDIKHTHETRPAIPAPPVKIQTIGRTKVTILPSTPFCPPSPSRPPPAPPEELNYDDCTIEDRGGFQTILVPGGPPARRSRPTTSQSPSKKYAELNLRPPIPITPLQHSMHLYGSTSTLPLPLIPEEEKGRAAEDKKHFNFSRRRTLFGNNLTVPSPNDHHLRRASYNSPSTQSVRLPTQVPDTPGTQLPPRPGTAFGGMFSRPSSSASVRSSKREMFKNFFKKKLGNNSPTTPSSPI